MNGAVVRKTTIQVSDTTVYRSAAKWDQVCEYPDNPRFNDGTRIGRPYVLGTPRL
jgi:hypothetical protein